MLRRILHRVFTSVHVLLVQSCGTGPVVHHMTSFTDSEGLSKVRGKPDSQLHLKWSNENFAANFSMFRKHGTPRILLELADKRGRFFPRPRASLYGTPRMVLCDAPPAMGKWYGYRD